MITGEERLRENLTDLYGNVLFYEGRPSQTEVERTDALSRELADVVHDFDAWTAKELPSINAALAKKKLDPITPLTKSAWDAANGGASGATAQRNESIASNATDAREGPSSPGRLCRAETSAQADRGGSATIASCSTDAISPASPSSPPPPRSSAPQHPNRRSSNQNA